jgi:hypothetical protein
MMDRVRLVSARIRSPVMQIHVIFFPSMGKVIFDLKKSFTNILDCSFMAVSLIKKTGTFCFQELKYSKKFQILEENYKVILVQKCFIIVFVERTSGCV